MCKILNSNTVSTPTLVNSFDLAVAEYCFQYSECSFLQPFTNAGKAVFDVEYEIPTTQFCSQAKTLKINAIKKNINLDAYRETCP